MFGVRGPGPRLCIYLESVCVFCRLRGWKEGVVRPPPTWEVYLGGIPHSRCVAAAAVVVVVTRDAEPRGQNRRGSLPPRRRQTIKKTSNIKKDKQVQTNPTRGNIISKKKWGETSWRFYFIKHFPTIGLFNFQINVNIKFSQYSQLFN